MTSSVPAQSVIVYDANPDALERRILAVQRAGAHASVVGSASRTAVLIASAAAAPGTLVLADLFATDRVSLDRPGQRLLHRLVRDPRTAHVRPVAWSAQRATSVVDDVRGAGAHGFVAATPERDDEQAALRAALAGDAVWPDAPGPESRRVEAAWQGWFAERFGMSWEWWIEPTLVRLASGLERAAVTGELVDSGVAKSTGHAAARMREVSRAVAGEHRNSAAAVAAAASLALAQIASHRPLAELPPIPVSLEHGARTVRDSPSLARAAGVTDDEIDDIVGLDALIVAERASGNAGPGAPAADVVRNERRWAAGRRAALQGARREEIDEVVAGMLARLDQALMAIDDARQDELYYPEARAAAALDLLDPQDAARLAEVTVDGDRVRWRDLTAAELAVATTVDVEAARSFTAAVDEAMLRRFARAAEH